jgi:hypothetical protein
MMNALVMYQFLAALFVLTLLLSTGYYLGYRKNVRMYRTMSVNNREEMLTIERALKTFWDHEKEKLVKEKEELERKIQFLEDRLDQYRRKAAGVGMMGLRKSKLSDMLVTLLLENETLEEKLFLQNLKLKQERDQCLENELRHISYKRILLSEIINQAGVRSEMERVLRDKGSLKRLDVRGRELEPTKLQSDEDEDTIQ